MQRKHLVSITLMLQASNDMQNVLQTSGARTDSSVQRRDWGWGYLLPGVMGMFSGGLFKREGHITGGE